MNALLYRTRRRLPVGAIIRRRLPPDEPVAEEPVVDVLLVSDGVVADGVVAEGVAADGSVIEGSVADESAPEPGEERESPPVVSELLLVVDSVCGGVEIEVLVDVDAGVGDGVATFSGLLSAEMIKYAISAESPPINATNPIQPAMFPSLV